MSLRRAHRVPFLAASLMLVGCRTTATTPETIDDETLEPPAASEPPGDRPAVTVAAVDNLETAFKTAIAEASPAVVSVYSSRTISVRGPMSPFGRDPLFEEFFGDGGPRRELRQRGLGSGFILDADGRILTNYHVIEGADEVRVKLADEREFEAEVIGVDPPTDLALLKIAAEGLPTVELGDSAALEVGDWIVVIGDPYGLPQTVSVGIVSAKGRADVGLIDYEDFIQIDAAVNPGNSGGPVVDLDGSVVGISTAIASRGGGSEGIAFAIPINMAKNVIEQLRTAGKVSRGQLGVVISGLSDELAESFEFEGEEGILVQDVVEGGAAAAAGIEAGDIITKLDGEAVEGMSEFRTAIARMQPGATVRLEIWRGGQAREITAKLAEAPSASAPRESGEGLDLGITLADPDPELRRLYNLGEQTGVVITSVAPRSPAAAADLQIGDLLQEVGDVRVESARQAARLLRDADLEKGVRLRVSRDGAGRYVFIRGG